MNMTSLYLTFDNVSESTYFAIYRDEYKYENRCYSDKVCNFHDLDPDTCSTEIKNFSIEETNYKGIIVIMRVLLAE